MSWRKTVTEKLFEEIYDSCNNNENQYDACQSLLDNNGNAHISENTKEPENSNVNI